MVLFSFFEMEREREKRREKKMREKLERGERERGKVVVVQCVMGFGRYTIQKAICGDGF